MPTEVKTGILLVNLGTPDSPDPRSVGKYLKQFLNDPYVIDIPAPLRYLLVNWLIVPRRSQDSAKLYQKIWTNKGSPLLLYHLALCKAVEKRLGPDVAIVPAMRYGKPSIPSAIKKLKEKNVKKIVAFPLYPQYSLAATQSSIAEIRKQCRLLDFSGELEFVPPFYNKEAYLNAVASISAPRLQEISYDHVLFSFHGLPESQVKKTDFTGKYCLQSANCCENLVEANANCYSAQCFSTANELAKRLGIAKQAYSVSFQSRLTNRWLKPFTDSFYRDFSQRGIKKVAVLCPSFVADCLETLEEVQIRGEEEFIRYGGERLTLIPSLNSQEIWVNAILDLLSDDAFRKIT